ncbi:MAG: bifunctional [glutamate--ammonia ligase]-adenylyl-L-tyrosine phosphorylase/[glutamate--ammonia-ligase] adenylyltransferase [Pseudomonadota bacterium]|nr:bifunctional [glutamate--ammonia ligase]-adenylyl-L-tyrosine phosphorylase/[glutamate--ammonia-ligase] adenylyltransferase [Pseudomonadota bacterium]
MLPETIFNYACEHSRYFARLVHRADFRLDLLSDFERQVGSESLLNWFSNVEKNDEDAVLRALRQMRQKVLGRIILRDLSGLADLDEVMRTMTLFAETAIMMAVNCATAQLTARYGNPIGKESGLIQQLIVIGMGKLGGEELNVSSDIDLIFAYPEEGETIGPAIISCMEFFNHVSRKVIRLLAEVTEDGFAFRVDMRLRPYGESGALCSSFASLENYYQSQGREWERYALIKARVVFGERSEELMQLLRPFVFRKYLDFGAFASMRGLYEQIRRDVLRRDRMGNIKTGFGGIREIEFCAQVFQLVRGGREPSLRKRPTLEVLEEVAHLGFLPVSIVNNLMSAYVFLRRLEHRLQYLDDSQTHTLPSEEGDCLLIAQSMGYKGVTEFMKALDMVRLSVNHDFQALFVRQQVSIHPLASLWMNRADSAEMQDKFHQLGFVDGVEWVNRLYHMRESSRYRNLSESAQMRLDGLIPHVIEAAARCPNKDETLGRMLSLIDSLERREAYFALLDEYPASLNQVAKICSASSWAAEFLAQHPILLDELLDERFLAELPGIPELRKSLRSKIQEAGQDVEAQFDAFSEIKNGHIFHLLSQDLAGILTVEQLSDHLSDLADLVLDEMLDFCWRNLLRKPWPDKHFAVIAYGRLGGRELGYTSDLDLVFLYEDDREDAPQIYARFAQHVNSRLNGIGREGSLYEIDLRLRPNGSSGLLVSSFLAYEHYLCHDAWVWELQALTRARFVTGEATIGRNFEILRRHVLSMSRDLNHLKAEIISMRNKMSASHPNPESSFDIKHDRGGMIDIEFMVQFLVLGYARDFSMLLDNVGNIALLERAAQVKLISMEKARAVCNVYREYRGRQHALKLNGSRYSRESDEKWSAPRRLAVMALWKEVFD